MPNKKTGSNQTIEELQQRFQGLEKQKKHSIELVVDRASFFELGALYGAFRTGAPSPTCSASSSGGFETSSRPADREEEP